MKYSAAFGLALIAATHTATPVFADDTEADGGGIISIGGSVGFGHSDFDDHDADSEAHIELFARYMLPMGLAFDFSYVDFGTHSAESEVIGTELEVDGFTLQAGYFYHASDLITLYGRGGYFMWDRQIESRIIGTNFVTSIEKNDDSGGDLTYGLGIDFHVTKNISLGGYYQHYDIDEGGMNAYALSGAYYFN